MFDTRAHLTNVVYLGVQTLEAFEILSHLHVLCLQRFCIITGHDILIYSVPLIFGTSRVSSDRDDWHSLSAGYYLFIRKATIANLLVAWIYLYPYYYFNTILCIIPMLLLFNT